MQYYTYNTIGYCRVLHNSIHTVPYQIRQTDRQPARQTDRHKQIDRQTDRKTDRQTDRHTLTRKYSVGGRPPGRLAVAT